jgi:hypothetical protein
MADWDEFHAYDPHAKGVMYLAVFMVYEKEKKNSFYSPYLDSLPTEFDSLPLHWTKEALNSRIGGTSLEFIMLERQTILKKAFDQLEATVNRLFMNGQFTW